MLEQLTEGASSLLTSVTDSAKSMTDEVVQQVTDLIEGVIVMIVTSCVIPLLVLVAFLWLGHVLLGIDISGPANYLTGRFSECSVQARQKGWAVRVAKTAVYTEEYRRRAAETRSRSPFCLLNTWSLRPRPAQTVSNHP